MLSTSLPVLLCGLVFLSPGIAKVAKPSTPRIAIVDETEIILSTETTRQEVDELDGFFVELVSRNALNADELRLRLSERVREGEIAAFIEIPASAIDNEHTTLRFFGHHLVAASVGPQIQRVVERRLLELRLQRAALPAASFITLQRPIAISTIDLSGRPERPDEVNPADISVPAMLVIFLMLASVMSASLHVLVGTIEEKLTNISDVLVGSVEPWVLLFGKVAALTLAGGCVLLVYLGSAIPVASLLLSTSFPLVLVPSLLLLFLCSSLMYGMLFGVVGSSCHDATSAQASGLFPTFVMVGSVVAVLMVIDQLDSPLAILLTLIPPTAPFAMAARLAGGADVRVWEGIASVAIMLASAAFLAWAAGRVFRITLLTRGSRLSLAQLLTVLKE